MQVTHPVWDDTVPLKRLWKEIFGDTDLYIDLFFQHKYMPQNTFVIRKDGCIVSMLYFFATSFRIGEQSVPVAYICGVATKPEERGHGYSQAILKEAIRVIRERGYQAAFLIPASESLFSFYRKTAGFEPYFCLQQQEIFFCKEKVLRPTILPLSAQRFADFYLQCNQKQLCFCEKTAQDFEELFRFYQPEGCQFHLLEDGYLICYPQKRVLTVREACFRSEEHLQQAIHFFMAENQCDKAVVTRPANRETGNFYASLLPLSAEIAFPENNSYVNLMLN